MNFTLLLKFGDSAETAQELEGAFRHIYPEFDVFEIEIYDEAGELVMTSPAEEPSY